MARKTKKAATVSAPKREKYKTGHPNYGGAREGAGKPASTETGEARVKVIASVLPDSKLRLAAIAAKERKGRQAKAGAFAAEILDGWAKDGKITGEKKYSEELPGAYEARRIQVTCWVTKDAALKIYEKSLEENTSRSAVSGKILDIWAKRHETLNPIGGA